MREMNKQSNGRTATKCLVRFTFNVSPLGSIFCFSLSAAETNSVSLPPPAQVKIVFDRDIRPILETSCLQCHGGEKPRSHFRLDDRKAALSGGDENTNDIVPGDSANSWLIQYVALQVTDMEMPPTGKGRPLASGQISRLREWIDQGASWNKETAQLSGVTWGADAEKQRVVDDFAGVQQWAKEHDRPILLGEFGAYEKGPMESRALYTSWVARTAESLGWAWTYWQFDSDFIVWDMKKDAWVEPIRKALIP